MTVKESTCKKERPPVELFSQCEDIRKRWLAVHEESASPDDRKTSLLKKELYQLVSDLAERHKKPNGALAELEALGLRRRQKGSAVFKIITRLIKLIAHDDLLAVEKRRYAIELEYAWRHRVPRELLIGFIWQVGGDKRIKTLEPKGKEEWFEDRMHGRGMYRGPDPKKW